MFKNGLFEYAECATMHAGGSGKEKNKTTFIVQEGIGYVTDV